ncbi:MAG: hypothetical protein ABIE70_03070 [bacterium]
MPQTKLEKQSLSAIFERIYGRRSAAMMAVLSRLADEGIRPIILNLPLCFTSAEVPNDLDLLLDPPGYNQALAVLGSIEFVRLPDGPDQSQSVLLRYLPQVGFVRVHLHRDLCYWGVCLVQYRVASSYCRAVEDVLVAGPILDYWVLLIEWFFRRKSHYRSRIEEVGNHLNQVPPSTELIEPSARGLARRVRMLWRANVAPTPWTSLRLVLTIGFRRPGLPAAVIGKAIRWARRWPLSARRGTVVFLMGVDGTGKTSLAEWIQENSRPGGPQVRVRYLGLKSTIVQCTRRRLTGRSAVEEVATQRSLSDDLRNRSKTPAGLFDLLVVGGYLMEYAIRSLLLLRVAAAANDLVVVDRGYYDKLAERHKPGNVLLYYLLPRPDLILMLKGDPGALYRRKPEIPNEKLSEMQDSLLDAAQWLRDKGVNVVTIDTTESDLPDVRASALSEIWRVVSDRGERR